MRKIFADWQAGKNGATAIEYALIAAAIALAVSVFIFQFGEDMYSFFQFLTDALGMS
jgi:Flp pilus assembly pilin Flp